MAHLSHTRQFWELVEDAKRLGKDKDPTVRQQLAWAFEQVEIIRIGGLQLMAALSEGRPVPRGTIGSKLRNSEFHKNVCGDGDEHPRTRRNDSAER